MTSFVFRSRRLSLSGLLLVTAGVGCDGEPGSSTVDAPNMDEVPGLELEEVLRIGSTHDPDEGFSRLGAVDVDEEGYVYALESSVPEIRVYDPEGELVRRIGRAGEGPGEFSENSFGLTFGLLGDTLWVHQNGIQQWLTLFERTGEVLSDSRVEDIRVPSSSPGRESAVSPRRMDDEGLFVGQSGMSYPGDDDAPAADSVNVPRIRFDADGQIVDTVGTHPSFRPRDLDPLDVGSSTFMVPRPRGSDPAVVLHADGYTRIDQTLPDTSAAVRITRIRHPADTLHSRLLRYDPKGFPAELLNELAKGQAHQVGPLMVLNDGEIDRLERHAEDTAAARRALIRRMEAEFPEHQLPVQRTRTGADGSLWLLREGVGDDEEARWTILDAGLEPVGEVAVPVDVSVRWSSGDTIWARVHDELDVPWLVRYRLRPPS